RLRWPRLALSVSCTYSSSAPAATRQGWSSSKPKPARVLTPKWRNRAARAGPGAKVQSGRGGRGRGAGAPAPPAAGGGGGGPRGEALGRGQPAQLVGEALPGDVGRLELPGGQFHPGQADRLAARPDGHEVVGAARVEEVILGEGTGRDDAGDLAADEPL